MSDEPKTYTTAIIAAVPSPTDPVHEVVAEDAHVTLQFLGESADLSPEAVDEIKATLEMLSSVVYPFQVPISGTAELGPNKAQVLIVQSELLTKIRETLALSSAVSTAVANSEQFPNWIPHLTLDYDGEMPDVSAYEMVEIGSLELWLGDEEHAVYRLDQKTAPVTAAGLKSFDPDLHPRGADGRFIEKFGVIKYLTSLGWAYGKVDGINQDVGGGVVLTVTPSDLSGNPKGESIVLSPKQVYRAPKAKAHLLTGGLGTKKIGGQGGSNPGGLYEIPSIGDTAGAGDTEKFYVKKPKTKSHGQNEALANALYEEAGVPVPEVDLASDGQLYSKIVEGQQDMAQKLSDPDWADQVRRNFAVDAWLGNRDVFGMTYDNILTDENGVPWRIDNGGALLYRAMGAKKDDFGGKVTELDGFRQGKKAQIFGPGMTKAQELDGAERVLAISPAQIEEMVAEHGLPKSLADTLKARRAYIADYYGLALPETKKPAEAEAPTSAPLVDTADIAENAGKTRNWFKSNLAQLALFAEAGDVVELPDGSTGLIGVDDDNNPLSIVGQQAQLLGWQTQYGAAAEIYHRKRGGMQYPRPDHGQMVPGADMTDQSWKRGDIVVDNDGVPWKVKTWNRETGAMLLQFADKDPVLFDTKGKDSGLLFKVERWDPPVAEVLDDGYPGIPEYQPVMTEQQGLDEISTLPELPNATADTASDDELTTFKSTDGGSYEQVQAPVEGKTGQAAVAEAAIKADLDQPLPAGNGTPAPKKTSAPGGAKVMIIGDGTEAATGDAVTSKKDGKTYTFVKPKGQYAVVTDPNGEDPSKQLLKLASTMTQPGKLPAGDLDVELPKTATGEVPALGMMALAKDGWAGEITLISPDGKFVFITDANGTRKRKSTGTVSITSAPTAVADVEVPKTAPGPVKPYGSGQKVLDGKAALGLGFLDFDDPADLNAGDMVLVAYADGTWGLEPYTGQPEGALGKNTSGKIATHNTIHAYQGSIAASQLAQAASAKGHTQVYTVVWDGTLLLTDGKTGPSGGLLVWDLHDPSSYAFELAPTGQVLSILTSEPVDTHPTGALPGTDQVTSFQAWDGLGYNPPLPLYGDEAKTLADWKGQLKKGDQISLDGQSWLELTSVAPISGNVIVKDSNGSEMPIPATSMATFVLKAPELKDAAAESSWKPEIIPATDVTDVPWIDSPTKKKIGDFVSGDVVTDGEGNVSIIDSVTDDHGVPGEVNLKVLGEDWGSPANPEFEFVFHGNINETPVDLPLGTVVPHLYPGATIQYGGQDLPWQVVSYPHQLGSGKWHVAVMDDGDPENLKMLTVGDWESGADISIDLAVSAQLGSFTSASDAGVDPIKLNALWAEANSSTSPTAGALDKKVEMGEAGIPFGTAAYPIHWGETSGTFFRPGANGGVEEWDPETSTWNAVFGGLLDKPKVWDGVPFEGWIGALIPEGYPSSLMLDSKGDLGTYQPKPGETIQVAKVKNIGGTQTVLLSYPMGLSNQAYPIWSTKNGNGPESSGTPLPDGWQDSGDFSDIVTIWDPFAKPSQGPQITNQSGPQPPNNLGAKLQTLGYTPSAGETFWAMSVEHPTGTATVVLLKQPDGNYKKIGYDGVLGNKVWTPEELKAYQADEIGSASPVEHYTWTYDPAGDGDTPALVQGLPEGYQPFAPGEGQSVLKVTLSNGKENVYLQKQPGAGWYEMGSDGTVNEHSDAVKSNHAVQMKLQGKGAQTAKYVLLHPLPEGSKAPGQELPTLTNAKGDWTPEPHQKVMSMVYGSNDPDPWFWFQDEPGGFWEASPNSPSAPTSVSDETMTGWLDKQPSSYTLVFDGATGQAAVDTPEKELGSFGHHVPKPGTKVYQDQNTSGPGGGDVWAQQEPGGKFYFVKDNGGYSLSGLTQDEIDADDAMKQVWPVEGASTSEEATPSFGGYTPPEGATVVHMPTTGSHYVQLEGPDGGWFKVASTGGLGGAQMDDEDMQGLLNDPAHSSTIVWPKGADQGTAGVFKGYQTEPGDIVFEITNASGIGYNPTYVKKASTGEWHLVTEGGGLSEDAYAQATVDWALGEYEINELQGTVKGAGAAVDTPAAPEAASTAYAGVPEDTDLVDGSYHFGEYVPGPQQLERLKALKSLHKGESVYAISDSNGPGFAIVVRNSKGQWSGVTVDGDLFAAPGGGAWNPANTLANDDTAAEAYFKSVGFDIHKLQFGAPAAPPAAVPSGPAVTLSNWEKYGIPAPEAFHHISDPSQGASAKAGDFVYMMGPSGVGLMAELAKDWDGSPKFAVSKVLASDQGELGGGGAAGWIPMDASSPFNWVDTNQFWISTQPAPSFPGATPVAAPSASAPAAPIEPVGPSYPGAKKPSQEDINAWGGALTKDGHIPTAQMFVTGKGPMSGKIISISKDKSKAVVLTSDGKKTTRLIEALKVDVSANYSAYAAPVTAKDIPQGMPLAVDTIAEALEKTVADGKFRAVLSAHQGISHGEMVITKATAPSGKLFNRVHLTLTPDQRDQLVAMLSGQGEKGDWATSSKMSDAVAIGDKLPMRKSSTDNPDGTPRWKVDPAQTPPTHEVISVTDEAGGAGIKIVTLKDVNTGEEITSRFHPGKTLTTYTWDPNKPKKAAPGAFSLSATAKAAGWSLAQDGGISAAKGGADNAVLYNEPGAAVTKSAFAHASSSWQTLRNVSADGVVIEMVNPKGSSGHSVTGTTVISVPQGVDETAFGAAMAKLGIDYSPMTQESAKGNVRGLLRTLLSLDTSDVDTTKGWSDEKMFSEAGKVMGISDLGWTDVLVGVDESTGKTSFFWSDRARNALKAKASYNLVYRSASTGSAAQIVSTVKYGSANSVLKRTTGMLDGTSHVGNGASWSSDSGNHAGHGSYASAGVVSKLPSGNSQASYKSSGMMVFHRPEAVLGRIMDYRLAAGDAFGMGKGQGANHLKEATTMSKVTDYFLGGGLPTEAVGFIAVSDASERLKAIEQLKKDGFAVINGRPVEDIIITKQKAATMSPDDLPPVTIPSNARPILDLPQSYDAAPAAPVTADAGEAA